jgi:hypothetical protein
MQSGTNESVSFSPGDGMIFNDFYNDREDNALAASPTGWVVWAEGNLVVTKTGTLGYPSGSTPIQPAWNSSPADCLMSGRAYLQGKGT